MWLDTWLINWRNNDASPILPWGINLNVLHPSWQLIICYGNDNSLVAKQQNFFVCNI